MLLLLVHMSPTGQRVTYAPDVKVDAANPRLGARRPGADDGAREGLGRDGPGAVTARAGYRSRDGRDARERHHAPARHPSPGRSNARASLVGENPSFVTLWAGFCQAACWAPSLFACAVALDSTRLARVLSNDTKRRCASVEPVQSPGRGLSMAEGRKRRGSKSLESTFPHPSFSV